MTDELVRIRKGGTPTRISRDTTKSFVPLSTDTSIVADGDKGDIVVSLSGTTWTIQDEAVTYAKMQNVGAASRILGRGSAGGAGDVQEMSVGSGLTISGTTLDLNAHATNHKSAGSDAIKLDELAAPTDVTTLDVSTTAHGLCPKAPNDTAKFLRGDASWATNGVTVAMGEISFTGNSTSTVITTTQTWTKVGITTSLNMSDLFDSPSAGRLRYIGTDTRMMHMGCTLSVKGAGANDTIKAILYKSGTVNGSNEYTAGTALTTGTTTQKMGPAGDISSTAIHVMTTAAQNDYFELAVWNDTDADDVTVVDMNLFAMGITT